MSKRLQVVLEDAELRSFRRAARRAGVTLSEWVRQTLRRAERETGTGSVDAKLDAIARAGEHAFPAPDIEQMNAEIERGYAESIDCDPPDRSQ